MESRVKFFGITADWQAVALCVVAASTFWFFNAMNEDHTADISYPVDFVYDDSKMIPTEVLPEKIRFNATGYGWNLLRKTLKVNRPPLVVNLENLSSHNHITARELLPVVKAQMDDIKVNYLLEDTIPLQLERIKEAVFTLRVDSASISLLPGYKITTPIRIAPERIYVKGPASIIKNMQDSFYVKIPEKNIESDYEEEIKLDFDLPQYIETEPDEVEVQFGVARFLQENIVTVAKLKNFPESPQFAPVSNEVILTVLVMPEDIEKLKNTSFNVILNFNKLNFQDSTIVPVLKDKPDFIKEYFFTPGSVKIKREP